MSFSPDPSAVIPQMVAAMENILSAAAQEESVKRFVLTSSSAAVLIAQANVEVEVTKGTLNLVFCLQFFFPFRALTSIRYVE